MRATEEAPLPSLRDVLSHAEDGPAQGAGGEDAAAPALLIAKRLTVSWYLYRRKASDVMQNPWCLSVLSSSLVVA